MSIILIGGVKGGSGKTTVATNLAIMRSAQARDVLLVDADPQGTATDFTNLRIERLGEAHYTSIALSGAAVRSQVQKLRDKYDDVIIDTGGRDSHSQRSAIAVSELLVIPFVPRSFDLWTLDQALGIVDEMRPANPKLEVMVFLNRTDPRGVDNDEARSLLADRQTGQYVLLPEQLGSRKAFGNAAAEGKSVVELRPQDPKATADMQALYRAVYKGIIDGDNPKAR
jgi:chromosome partitioning protein